jgi:hypothetical protein
MASRRLRSDFIKLPTCAVLKENALLIARRVLSCILVSIYAALLFGLIGGLLTFWMFGFGALLTCRRALP